MTFTQLKEIVGSELERVLAELDGVDVGLYYDEVPGPITRLYVRFWFPFTGQNKSAYTGVPVDRPLLQVDVRHFPEPGSVATPPPTSSEAVWEALRLVRFPGLAGCVRQPDSRPPMKDMGDHSRWGWHRFMLYVSG